MTSHAERTRARAELCSMCKGASVNNVGTDHGILGYIVRMRQSLDDQVASQPHPANNGAKSAPTAPAHPAYNDNYNSNGIYNYSAPGPQRGSSVRGRGGAHAYHPYQRPMPRYRNQSVVFNSHDSCSTTPEDGRTTASVMSNTRPGQGSMQQTEAEAPSLCRTFTLTGTQETDNPAFLSY
jgi:hypothetical protein